MMSLRVYLRSRLLILGIAVSLPIIYLVFSLYELGLDDATEGYLKEDITYARFQLDQIGILPKSTAFRHYYLGVESLPAAFKQPVKNQRYSPYYIWQTDTAVYYGVRTPYKNKHLYLFHVFAIDEDISGIQLETVVVGFVCLILFLMMLGATLIYQRIASAMKYLSKVSKNSSTLDTVEHDCEFTEINHVAQALKESMLDLERKNSHERYFIQSLSHELRTPMAIIQVAIELLKKQVKASGDERLHEKLNTIFNANLKMQALANNLLSLWGKSRQQEKSQVNINQVIAECAADLNEQYGVKSRFNMQMPSQDVIICAPLFAVQLVLNNLIKNAVVHGEGVIDIKLTEKRMDIKNHVANTKIKTGDSVGMGLFIVAQGIECLDWQMQQVTSRNEYQVNICFSE
ncbi:MAG: HAMP domain-containing histidine kinase [Bermanella sp.]